MKKIRAFFTISLLVCSIALIAFASNQNRDTSQCFLSPDDEFPGGHSNISCIGSDSEGSLSSSADTWTGFFREYGNLRFGASGSGYVSCSSDNSNYRTTYSLHAKVASGLTFPNSRTPETLPRDGSFSDSIFVSGEGDGMFYNHGSSAGSASASGKNRSSGAQHNTSAAAPTPETARDIYP